MTNREIAETLFNIAAILEANGGDRYRIRAYRRAAMMILALPWELAPLVQRGVFPKIRHIGDRLSRKIAELIVNGQMAFYEELCSSLPSEQRQLIRIRGIGPKTAERLSRELHVSTPAELLVAARSGRVRQLYRFGVKREHNLAEAAAEAVAKLPEAEQPLLPAASPETDLSIQQPPEWPVSNP